MNRIAVALALALVLPACHTDDDDHAPIEPVFYVSGSSLMGGDAVIDQPVTDWRAIPHKSIVGSNVTYTKAVGTIVYVKNGQLWAFDGHDRHRVTRENQAAALVALIDVQQVLTFDGTSFIFYTTTGGEFRCANVGQHVHNLSQPPDEHELPQTLETSWTLPLEVRAPTSSSSFVYYLVGTALKRVELVRFPVVAVNTMSGADAVVEFLPRDQDTVVYRRSDGDIMESTIPSVDDPVPTTLFDGVGTDLLALRGDEVYFSTHSGGSLTLRRAMLGGGVVTVDGPYSATSVSLNVVAFTSGSVVWGHVRDATSHLRAGAVDLMTPGRALTRVVTTGTATVVFEEGGFVVAKTDAGALLGEAAGSGAAVYGGTAVFNIVANLFFASAISRIAYTSSGSTWSRALDMSGPIELGPAVAVDGAFGPRDVVAGLFFLDATVAGSVRAVGFGAPIGAN